MTTGALRVPAGEDDRIVVFGEIGELRPMPAIDDVELRRGHEIRSRHPRAAELYNVFFLGQHGVKRALGSRVVFGTFCDADQWIIDEPHLVPSKRIEGSRPTGRRAKFNLVTLGIRLCERNGVDVPGHEVALQLVIFVTGRQ